MPSSWISKMKNASTIGEVLLHQTGQGNQMLSHLLRLSQVEPLCPMSPTT